MSHTTIAATRDYIPGHNKGELIDPAQSASFTTDPLLTPITTSAMPKPMLPDPTPSENPELFDKSTSHPNTHYHPDAKLSKKKRAKKLGTGYIAKPHGGAHGEGGVHAGGRTFSEHEKDAHERAERRDAAIGAASEEAEEEWETDDDDEAQQDEQSRSQHHENRVTGTEKGQALPSGKRSQDEDDKGDDSSKDDKEGGDEQDKSDNSSLMQRATNVVSSAQQKVTGMATGVASSVMSTAQSVPVVGALLSKVGLGAAKSDDKGEESTGDKSGDQADDSTGDEQQPAQSKQGHGQAGGDNDARSKVGGAKEAATEATQAGGSETSTKEAATRGGGEAYGKAGARQDNHEGGLDKARSHAGQKAVNMQASKEEEA